MWSRVALLGLVFGCGKGGDDEPAPTRTDTGTPPAATQAPPVAKTLRAQESVVQVSWEQAAPAEVWVEYSFDPDVWLSSPHQQVEGGPVKVLLLGIPYGERVAWRVVTDEGGGPVTGPEDHLKIPRLPSDVPVAQVLASDPTGYDPSVPYVFTSMTALGGGAPTWAFIVDRQGRVVWAQQSHRGRAHMHAHLSYDGAAMLIDQNSFWALFDGGAQSTVERVKIDGTVEQVWETPGLHHPFTQLADGSLAYGRFANGWYGDEHLVVLHDDGTVEQLWSCLEFLAEIGDEESLERGCGSNTLRYDELSGSFLFSFYTFETVVEIDRAGDTLRWFGHAEGAYAFDPEESTFWYQHGAHFTPSGTMLLSTYDDRPPKELVVREYALDAGSSTLREVWSFGVGQGVLGEQMGEVTILPNGNVHHNYGMQARLREATHDGRVVWDVSWPGSSFIGRSTPLGDLYALAP